MKKYRIKKLIYNNREYYEPQYYFKVFNLFGWWRALRRSHPYGPYQTPSYENALDILERDAADRHARKSGEHGSIVFYKEI